MTFEGSGTGRELKKTIPEIREREGNKKIHSQISGMGREWKNPIPKIQEREGNEKNPFPEFGNGKGMKKSIPKVREREPEASILGNGREREFPLTPGLAWRNKIDFWTTALHVNIALDKLCVLFRAAQLSKEVKKTALEK